MYNVRTATAVTKQGKAPVAQLDRASDYGSEGLGFESLRACFLSKGSEPQKKYREFEQPRLFLTLILCVDFHLHLSQHGGVPVSTEHSRRRLHVEVDRLASLKAAQTIKCLFQ